MTRYFNLRTNYGIETVDEVTLTDFDSKKEFNKEIRRIKNEYHIAGMNVYTSQRPDKTWKA